MSTRWINLTEDQFEERYTLLVNHIDPNASWASGDENGCLFETYGPELDFVRAQDPRCIWTVIDGDDGTAIVSGYHLVNRIGYLISTEPAPEGVDIDITIDEEGSA